MVHRGRLRPRVERSLGDRQRRVGHDQLGVDDALEAEAVAALAGAVRRVEREDPRLDLRHRSAAVEAREALGVDLLVASLGVLDRDQPVGELRGRLDRLREALADALLHHQAVDHDRDVVLVLLVELDLLVEPPKLAVDHRPRVALRAHLGQHPPVLALAPADDGRHHHEALALLDREHAIGDLLEGLALDGLAAVVAVGLADPGPQQAQVVVDLGDRADRRARVARSRLLVDRDRGREALDRVDVRLLHQAQELARVRRERLDIAALSLRVEGVERQARLTRPREARDHDQGIARKLEIDALQVVRPGPRDDDFL